MYYNGRGTAKDYVRAYMWFSLSGEDVVSTVAKQKMVRRMTPAQIAQAQEMTSQCKAQNLKNCD
jgi:TPR repeat protein